MASALKGLRVPLKMLSGCIILWRITLDLKKIFEGLLGIFYMIFLLQIFPNFTLAAMMSSKLSGCQNVFPERLKILFIAN